MVRMVLFQVILLIFNGMQGINSQPWMCPSQGNPCPSSLAHRDGSIIRGIAESKDLHWPKDTSPKYKDSEIVMCESSGFRACSSKCHNGGTCMPSQDQTKYECHCDLGYDGATCNNRVQVLTVNPNWTAIMVANVSDLVFSEFVDLGDSPVVRNIVYDDSNDVLYWINSLSAKSEYSFYPPSTCNIKMVKMATKNIETVSEKDEKMLYCLALDVEKEHLYWSTFPSGIKRRPIERGEIKGRVSDVASETGKEVKSAYRCVIDQQRRFFYSLHTGTIARFHLDTLHGEMIMDNAYKGLADGLHLDERGERLFYSLQRNIIKWVDLKNFKGPFTLPLKEIDNYIQVTSLRYVAGWLVWFNRARDEVCASRAESDVNLELCQSTSADGLINYLSMSQSKYLALA